LGYRPGWNSGRPIADADIAIAPTILAKFSEAGFGIRSFSRFGTGLGSSNAATVRLRASLDDVVALEGFGALSI